jgi:hypothetical protein
VPVGNTVIASAGTALTLNIGRPVTYRWWSGTTCSGTQLGSNTKTLVLATSIPPSDPLAMTTVGPVSFRATYDALLGEDATSPCVLLTVTPRAPSVTVTPPAAALTAGSSASSTTTMSGGYQATGSLTYSIFPTEAACLAGSAPTTSANVTIITAGTMPASGAMLLDRTGATGTSLYWRVAYSGDANNNPTTSACAAKDVAKQVTTVGLSLSPTTVSTAQGTIGTATLAGGVLMPKGTATYTVYADASCATVLDLPAPNQKTLVAGNIPNSDPLVIPSPGLRWVQVIFNGDDNNLTSLSGCMPVTVMSLPTLVLSISPAVIPLGQSPDVTSALIGATADASGIATYAVYADDNCGTPVAPAIISSETVVNASIPPAAFPVFTAMGTFYAQVEYSGDSLNTSAESSCVPFAIAQAAPSISISVAPDPITAGQSTTTSSVISGTFGMPSGSVIYRIFSDPSCSTETASSSKPLSGGLVPASDPFTSATVGTIYANATYSGDASHQAAVSTCLPVSVTKATPLLSLTQTPDPVAIGGSFSYQFALSGTVGQATGTVSLQLYTASDCGTAINGQSYAMTLASGAVPDSPLTDYSFSGTAYARATYSGDATHNAAGTGCVPVSLMTGTLTASAVDLVLPSIEYSNDDQTSAGQITLVVADTRGTGAGWSVTVSTSTFAYSGVAPNQVDIPAANLSLTSAGSPVYVTGQPIGTGGPVGTSASGPLDVTRTLIVASPGWGSGSYTQPLDVELTIPGGSAAGTYTAELTITTSAAP